jgi:hypothetical protein
MEQNPNERFLTPLTLSERVNALMPKYKEMFAERGGVTPSDPLEFHLNHLARYWSRLVGFCRQNPSRPEGFIESDLGSCIAVGSEFANELIGPTSPIHGRWQEYWKRTQAILHDRPVTIEDVEVASRIFDDCLAELKYDPWS